MVHIHDIRSIEDWTNHYVEEGQKFLNEKYGDLWTDIVGPSLELRQVVEAHLLRYIPMAHQIKAAQLGKSGEYFGVVKLTTVSASVPGGKWLASSIGARAFRQKVVGDYGLKDDEPVLWLIVQGMVDSGVLDSKPSSLTGVIKEKAKEHAKVTLHFAWNEGGLREEVYDELVREFGDEVAGELFDTAAAFVPVVGTAYSCVKGAMKATKKLDEVIQSTQKVALRVHNSIVIPVVLERLGFGLKKIQEWEAKRERAKKAAQRQTWNPYITLAATVFVGYLFS